MVKSAIPPSLIQVFGSAAQPDGYASLKHRHQFGLVWLGYRQNQPTSLVTIAHRSCRMPYLRPIGRRTPSWWYRGIVATFIRRLASPPIAAYCDVIPGAFVGAFAGII